MFSVLLCSVFYMDLAKDLTFSFGNFRLSLFTTKKATKLNWLPSILND